MDGYHPKRRKDKLNPYNIYIDEKQHYMLSFKDGQGVVHKTEISEQLYDMLNQCELEDLSHLNEVDRHIEQSELSDISLNARALLKPIALEEIVMTNITNEQLHIAISQLPDIQRRRLSLYYFDDFTYEEIANIEGCTFQAVAKSISVAEKNIKKYFCSNGLKNRF